MNFLILGLPRSRTAWLSNFFTYDTCFCFHEPLLNIGTLKELPQKLAAVNQSIIGGADTGAMYFVDTLVQMFPGLKLIVIDRDDDDCQQSLSAMGVQGDIAAMRQQLNWVIEQHNPWVIPFAELDSLDILSHLWAYCVGSAFPVQRWHMLKDMIVQIDSQRFFHSINEQAIRRIAKEATVWPGAQ